MATFLGKSTHSLDDKGRLILPKRLMDLVAVAERDLMLTAGFEGCLLLLDQKTWGVVSEKVSGELLVDRRTRAMRRLFLGHAEHVRPDRTNRIVIAEPLREYAGIDGKSDVVLVGTGSGIEIWAKSRWESVMQDAASSFDETVLSQ